MAAAFEVDVQVLTKVISAVKSEPTIHRDRLHQMMHIEGRGIVMALTKLETVIVSAGIAYLIILLTMTAYGASHFISFMKICPHHRGSIE